MTKHIESSSSKRSYEDRVRSLQQRYRAAGGGSPSKSKSPSSGGGGGGAQGGGSYGRLRKMLAEDLEADREKHCDSILGRLADSRKDNHRMERRVHEMEHTKRETESAERVARSRAADMEQIVQQCRREIALLTEENDKLRSIAERSQNQTDNVVLRKEEVEREAARMDQKAQDYEKRLAEVHSTSLEYQARVEELLADRADSQKMIDREKMAVGEAENKIRELTRDLEQSERDRLQLKTEYVEMGEKFQELMQYEDREHDQAVTALGGKVTALQDKLALYKRRLQEASKDKQELIQRKDKEVLEARQEVHDYQSRYDAREREITTNLQLANMKAIGDVMPTTTHHQIVTDLKDTHQKSHADTSKTLDAKHAHELAEQRRQFETTLTEIKGGVKALEFEKEQVLSNSNDLEKKYAQMENRLQEASSRRDELAKSLNMANEHLSKIRGMYEEECGRRGDVEAKLTATLESVRKEEVSAERAIAALQAENKRLLELTDEVERHRNAVTDTKEELRKRTELHTQVMHANELSQRELDYHKKSLSEVQTAHNWAKDRLSRADKVEPMLRAKCAKLQAELQQLRTDFRFEFQNMQEFIRDKVGALQRRGVMKETALADLHVSHQKANTTITEMKGVHDDNQTLREYLESLVKEVGKSGQIREDLIEQCVQAAKPGVSSDRFELAFSNFLQSVDHHIDQKHQAVIAVHKSDFDRELQLTKDDHQEKQSVLRTSLSDLQSQFDDHRSQFQKELDEKNQDHQKVLESHGALASQLDSMPAVQEMIFREAEKPLKDALRSLKADFDDLQMQYNLDMTRKDREVEAELEKRIMQYEATTEAHVGAAKEALARQNDKVPHS